MIRKSYQFTWTTRYKCPLCQKVIRTESSTDWNFDGYEIICLFTILLPITLIYYVVKGIIFLYNKTHSLSTIFGENICFCKNCKLFIARRIIFESGQLMSGTRIIQKDELTETIVPRYNKKKFFQKKYKQYLSYHKF